MPWQWQLTSPPQLYILTISNYCRGTFFEQLSCGNRIVLTDENALSVGNNTIEIIGWIWCSAGYIYIWFTNDDRRKLLKRLKKQ